MQQASRIWEPSDFDFEAELLQEPTRTRRLGARALTSLHYNNSIKAKAHASGKDMFCLPTLWPSDRKKDELRRLFDSVPADVPGPLKSVIEWVLRDLSAMVQVDHFGPSNSNHSVEVAENYEHGAQIIADFTENRQWGIPNWNHMVLSADIGIPEPCTDILYLLIDDLLHSSENKIDRYHRIWSSTGSVMLVSSTTVRSFDVAGYLVKVRHHVLV